MKIGTYYYPEQWPREQWERDFDHIAAHGAADRPHGRVRVVHDGARARESSNSTGWTSALEMAAKRKIEVILCTPTAAPADLAGRAASQTSCPIDHVGRPRAVRRAAALHPASPRDARRGDGGSSPRWPTALAPSGGHRLADRQRVLRRVRSDRTDTHRGLPAWLAERYADHRCPEPGVGQPVLEHVLHRFLARSDAADRDPEYGNPHQRARCLAFLVVGVRAVQQAPGRHP